MSKYKFFILGFLVLASNFNQLIAQSDYGFPDDPYEFIAEVDTMLLETNSQRSIDLAEDFKSAWNSLNGSQQEKIIALSRQMKAKNFTMSHEFTELYGAITNGMNAGILSGSQVDDLIWVSESVMQNYSKDEASKFFRRMYHFFTDFALFYDSYDRIYTFDGSYSLDFVENSQNAENNPTTTESGAVIRVNGVDLTLASPFDSVTIANTSGTYIIESDVFIGSGGNFDWADIFVTKKYEVDNETDKKDEEPKSPYEYIRWNEYPDFQKGDAYCEFNNFTVEALTSKITAVGVNLTYDPLLNGSIEGDFEYQSKKREFIYDYSKWEYDEKGDPTRQVLDSSTVAEYPIFISAKEDIQITKLGMNVEYIGGFDIKGQTRYGRKNLGYAQFYGLKGNDKRFEVRGKLFEFRPDSMVTSRGTKFSAYMTPDSIFHTSIDLIYKPQANMIEMIKDKNGDFSNTPFINNHHKFYIYADALHYNIESDSLDMFMRNLNEKDSIPMIFESFDFFDRDLYGAWGGLYNFHPLDIFYKYYQKTGNISFTIGEVATTYDIPLTTLRGIAYQLMAAAYLEYEPLEEYPESGMITLGYRLIHQVESYNYQGTAKAVNKYNRDPEAKQGEEYPYDMEFTNPRYEMDYYAYDYDDMYIRAYEYMRYDKPSDSANAESAKFLDNMVNSQYMEKAVNEEGRNANKVLIELLSMDDAELAATLDATPKGEVDEFGFEEESGLDIGEEVNKSDNAKLYDLISSIDREGKTGEEILDSLLIISGKQTEQEVLNLRNFKLETEDDIWSVLKTNPLTSEVSVGDKVTVPMASMNMEALELVLRGIKDFYVSYNLNVKIEPKGKLREITIFTDRFVYVPEGEVSVGDTRFIGKKFFLNYEGFTLEMEEIENILFVLRDSTGRVIRDNLGLTRQYGGEIHYDESGTVYINDMDNKSGLRQGGVPMAGDQLAYSTYPMVDIPDGGYVNFDDDRTAGLYNDTTKINFVMPDIKLDSLYLKDPQFPGVFNSNIFPPFQETLIGMPDGSMGFRHDPPDYYPLFPNRQEVETNYQEVLQIKSGIENTPSAKIDIYPDKSPTPGAKMNFGNNDLVLDADGLYAEGDLTYLTADLETKEVITFTPNLVFSDGVNFRIMEQIGDSISITDFAQAEGDEARLLWFAEEDSMLLDNSQYFQSLGEDEKQAVYRSRLFSVYPNTEPIAIEGTLVLRQIGLFGFGDAFRKDFEIHTFSEDMFHFTTKKMTGKGTEFSIYSQERDPYTYSLSYYNEHPFILRGNFVDLDFNLEKGKARVSPNIVAAEIPGYEPIEFPYAQYKTDIDNAIWDLNNKEINMKGDEYSLFTSIYWANQGMPERDVFFNGSEARYDIKSLTSPYMEIRGVPQLSAGYSNTRDYLKSVDAIISPDSGLVVIRKDAEIDELKNAQMQIDDQDPASGLGGYHNLIEGEITVEHRIAFYGNATYQYTNIDNDTFNIKFDKFDIKTEEEVEEELKAFEQTTFSEDAEEGDKKKKKDKKKEEEEEANSEEVDIDVEEEDKKKKKDKKKKDKNNDDLAYPDKKEDGVKLVTVAKGDVYEENNFYITSGFLFQGVVTMYANKKNLALDGFIKTDLKNGGSLGGWMPYKRAAGDALLVFDEEIKSDQGTFTSGIHIDPQGFLYTTFVAPKRADDHANVFLGSGNMDVTGKGAKTYTLINPNRAKGESVSGNKLIFKDETGELLMQGDFNFMDEVHAEYLYTSGDADVFVQNETGDYSFNLMLMFDLEKVLPKKAVAAMKETVASNLPEEPKALSKVDKTTYRLSEIIGEKSITKYFAGGENLPVYEIDNQIARSIILSDAELHWSEFDQVLFSNGKIKLLNVFDKELNAEVEGYVEVRINPNKKGFSLYFIAGEAWYYIDMSNNILSAYSSDEVFNNQMASNITKKPKEGEFAIAEASASKAENFRYKFVDIYPEELKNIEKRRKDALDKIEN